MKRIVQEPGIKKWAGDDLVSLQEEPMKVLDLMFKPYGACIIEGCQVVGSEIKPGIVALQGVGSNGLDTFKVVPFAGQINIASFPVYLVLAVDAQMREYVDGEAKPVAYSYYAAVSTVIPSGSNYITINTTGNRYLVDAIQDSKHRFATDAEKTTWNAKASTAVATTGANGLLSNTDKAKLDGIASNANNYTHPSTHPATMIVQDANNRFVTDTEKTTWNAKASTAVATTGANGLLSNTDKAKLDGIASNANNYTHPDSHPATMIIQDANNRFVSDAEKAGWNRINNIEIGGRNLADATNRATFNYSLAGIAGDLTIYSPNSFAFNEFGVAIQNINSPSGNLLFLLDKTRFEVGQTYTISFDFYAQNSAQAIKALLVESYRKTLLSDGVRKCTIGNNHLIYTGVYTSAPNGLLHFELSGFDFPYTYVLANLKIERGNVATDYSRSDNDVIYSPVANTTTNGLMSNTDKTKLDRITGGKATVSVIQPTGAQLGDMWIKP